MISTFRLLKASAVVLLLALVMLAPARSVAQATVDIGTIESRLGAGDWQSRADAVDALARRAPEITAMGLTQLIDLLGRELDGSAPVGSRTDGDEESYGQYMMTLTALITRFNDPRATPLLARQGIAIVRGSVYQVAMAGDAGIDPLTATWNETPALRPAVIITMGEMRHYADSTGQAISAQTRQTIDAHLLVAATDAEPWVRHAFVDAVASTRDVSYLPIVDDLRVNDPAVIGPVRYVARDADAVASVLRSRRDRLQPNALIGGLAAIQTAACAIDWIARDGTCISLAAKLEAARDAIARGATDAARGAITAFVNELSAQRGKAVSERAYTLLSTDATYLALRL